MELPAGFELGVLRFDRLNTGDRFSQEAVGANGFRNSAADLIVDQGIGYEGQHDEQGQRTDGDQGEGRADPPEHHQEKKTEAEIKDRGQRLANQEVTQLVKFVEVVGDLAHRAFIEKSLGETDESIQNRLACVHVHPVSYAGEDQAAQGRDHRFHHTGGDENDSDADHTIDRVGATPLGLNHAENAEAEHDTEHSGDGGASEHLDKFLLVGCEVRAVPGPAETALLAAWAATEEQQPQPLFIRCDQGCGGH